MPQVAKAKRRSARQRPKARRRRADVVVKNEAKPSGDYSVNALSKLLGKDRRTIDKAVAGVAPTRVAGKTKFYRLEDVEQALKAKPGQSLREEKLVEEIRKLRIANDREEEKLILTAAVGESVRRCLGPAAATLEQRLVNEYPTAVAGLDVPQARIYGKRLTDELLGFFQALASEWEHSMTAANAK